MVQQMMQCMQMLALQMNPANAGESAAVPGLQMFDSPHATGQVQKQAHRHATALQNNLATHASHARGVQPGAPSGRMVLEGLQLVHRAADRVEGEATLGMPSSSISLEPPSSPPALEIGARNVAAVDQMEEEMKAAIAANTAGKAAAPRMPVLKRPAASNGGEDDLEAMKKPTDPEIPADRTPVHYQGGRIYDTGSKIRAYQKPGDRLEKRFGYSPEDPSSRQLAYAKSFRYIDAAVEA